MCQAWWFDDRNEAIPNLVTELPSLENGGISADERTITLYLRQDSLWSDGVPITTADFLFTYDMVMSDKNAVYSRHPYDQIESFEPVDDFTLQITFRQPFVSWQSSLFSGSSGISLLPAHILQPVFEQAGTLDNADWNRAPTVGCGPFVFKEWVPGDSVRFVTNENYWLGRPRLDELIFRFLPDESTRIAAMLAGEGDVGTFSLYSDLSQLDKAGIKSLNSYNGSSEGWYFNLHPEKGHPALKDWRVRQAIALALDRQKLVQELFLGRINVAATPWDNSPWVDPAIQPLPYDPEKAKALLDEAGWVDSNGDGTRDSNGVELVLKYGTTNREVRQKAQGIAQQDLAQVGIRLDLQSFDSSTFFASYTEGGPANNFSLDIIEYINGPGFPDPNFAAWRCAQIPSDQNPYGQNASGLCDEELEALYIQGRSQVDFAQLQQTYYQISGYIYTNVYWLGLWEYPDIIAVSDRMLNVKASGAMPFFNVAEWDVSR
jgi:peptide/nickel transport system substrate-binding protein